MMLIVMIIFLQVSILIRPVTSKVSSGKNSVAGTPRKVVLTSMTTTDLVQFCGPESIRWSVNIKSVVKNTLIKPSARTYSTKEQPIVWSSRSMLGTFQGAWLTLKKVDAILGT